MNKTKMFFLILSFCFVFAFSWPVAANDFKSKYVTKNILDRTGEYNTVAFPDEFSSLGLPGRLFWLDKTRLIMSLKTKQSYTDPLGYKRKIRIIIVWDTETGKVTEYPHLQGYIECFNPKNGWLQIKGITKEDGDNNIINFMQGYWGKPLEDYHVIRDGNSYINQFSCKRHQGQENRLLPDKHITTPLYEEHGLLDWGKMGTFKQRWKKTSILTYRKMNSNQSFEIPYIFDELQGLARITVKHYPFNDSYLLSGKIRIDPSQLAYTAKDRRAARRLTPNGKVERIPVPSEFWEQNNYAGASVHLVRSGILWVVGGDMAGSYLQETDGKLFKLLGAGTSRHSVSTDGCRVVYARKTKPTKGSILNLVRPPKKGSGAKYTIEVINLCN